MDKKEHYRQVFLSFKNLCATDQQPCSFSKYCREHGLEHAQVRQILGDEFQNIRTLPGYTCVNSRIYATIYENFKNLCAEGRQPGSFAAYCRSFGISWSKIHSYMKKSAYCDRASRVLRPETFVRRKRFPCTRNPVRGCHLRRSRLPSGGRHQCHNGER